MHVILFAVLFGLVFTGCGGENPRPEKTEGVSVSEVEISGLETFLTRISFANATKLPEEKYRGFHYETSAGVLSINPTKFYKENKHKKNVLEKQLEVFRSSKLIYAQSGKLSARQKKADTILKHLNPIDSGKEVDIHQYTKSLEDQYADGDKSVAEALVFVYQAQGNYRAVNRLLKQCPTCVERVYVAIEGIVKDENGDVIKKAMVEVLNTGKKVRTDKFGKFLISTKVPKLSAIRLRAWKGGYSDDYQKVYVASDAIDQLYNKEFNLTKAHNFVQLDLGGGDFSREEDGVKVEKSGDRLILNDSINSYTVPVNSLRSSNKEPYEGEINVSLFNFDQSNSQSSLLQLDTLSGDSLMLDGVMNTYGMPYVQIFDAEGKELLISKDNPIQITVQMVEKDFLYNGAPERNISGNSQATIDRIIAYSQENEVTGEYLKSIGATSFPLWWVLDRNKGVWEEVPYRNLTEDLKFETVFYSSS